MSGMCGPLVERLSAAVGVSSSGWDAVQRGATEGTRPLATGVRE